MSTEVDLVPTEEPNLDQECKQQPVQAKTPHYWDPVSFQICC